MYQTLLRYGFNMYLWFIQVYQILLLYGFDMLPLVDTKTLLLYSFDVLLFVCLGVMCYLLFILVYQILLLYLCKMLPFVDTWVSDFALVLMWYVTFCWYTYIRLCYRMILICYLLLIHTLLLSIRHCYYMDFLCYLLFIRYCYVLVWCVLFLIYQTFYLVWYSLNQFIDVIYLGADLHMHLSIFTCMNFFLLWHVILFSFLAMEFITAHNSDV